MTMCARARAASAAVRLRKARLARSTIAVKGTCPEIVKKKKANFKRRSRLSGRRAGMAVFTPDIARVIAEIWLVSKLIVGSVAISLEPFARASKAYSILDDSKVPAVYVA